MASHRRDDSIPHVRLSQPLPPLPPPLSPISLPQLTISTQLPYRDNPDEESSPAQVLRSPSQPPGYEPMYDYLRSHQPHASPPIDRREDLTSEEEGGRGEQYRDNPFIISIENGSSQADGAPPPSYNDIYRANEIEMRNLMREFDMDDTPAEQTEELCKWVVAMLLIALTVACVGTAFNWGRPRCEWSDTRPGNC